MENEMAMLNPQIEEVWIGIKEMRKIKIYPLSARDQLKIIGLFGGIRDGLKGASKKSNLTLMVFIGKAIGDNLGLILNFITDEGERLIDELTNSQIAEIADIVYRVNFEVLEKKTISLLQKVTQNFQSLNSSPVSSETIPNTDLTTSLESPSEKEE